MTAPIPEPGNDPEGVLMPLPPVDEEATSDAVVSAPLDPLVVDPVDLPADPAVDPPVDPAVDLPATEPFTDSTDTQEISWP
jgi:hypothetical protein